MSQRKDLIGNFSFPDWMVPISILQMTWNAGIIKEDHCLQKYNVIFYKIFVFVLGGYVVDGSRLFHQVLMKGSNACMA